MKVQIMGMGCAKCKTLEQNARDAIAAAGVDAEVEKVSDPAKIAEMGVMMTPAIAIDGIVKSAGKVLTKEQIAPFIKGEK
jgi:small redox-active disulfide protein 2